LRKDRPKGLRQVKDDEIGVGSEIGARLAIRYSKEFWNYVRAGIEHVTRAPGHTLGDEVKAQPPISTSPGTMSGDRQEPRESVTILAEDRGLAKLHADQDLCIDVDPAAVFLTISRLRPQKGAVREEQREA
jgi:hypothetical protein